MQSCSQFVGACINQGTENIDGKAQYRLPMGLLILLPLAMLVLLPFIPESPVWFMYKNKKEKAEQALYKIHRSSPDYNAEEDLNIITAQVEMEREDAEASSWMSLLTDPIERRKLLRLRCHVCPADQ